ncbi:MAG TPA: AAA family ATPase [Leptospiraceae bacterium]|nr:AAA family ATPase [Leptospiraceae bacterium]
MPVGIQTFKDIRDGNYLYVDKTRWIYEMVKDPKGVYFFSRPRRFGKSLTLSVLKEIFEGNKELFQGLWICEAKYDWKKYPIIRIDFSKQKSKNTEQLDSIAEELGIAESQLLEKVQNWYNGYCFSSQGEKVYNPFSTICKHRL